MKLYDSPRAPSPKRVRIFLAEKKIEVPLATVDLGAKEHWGAPFMAVNPFRLVPALELDDGTVIVESVAICRYFEEIQPDPPLFGTGAVERAQVEMWNRLIELEFYRHVAHAFRHAHPAMAEREVPQIPELAESAKPKALSFLETFDRELAGRPFAAGNNFSIADITGLATMDFLKLAQIDVPEKLKNVARWYGEVSARPSATA